MKKSLLALMLLSTLDVGAQSIPKMETPLTKDTLIKRCQVMRDRVKRELKKKGIATDKHPLLNKMEEQLNLLEKGDELDALMLMAAGECQGIETAALALTDSNPIKTNSVLTPPNRRRVKQSPSEEDYKQKLREYDRDTETGSIPVHAGPERTQKDPEALVHGIQ